MVAGIKDEWELLNPQGPQWSRCVHPPRRRKEVKTPVYHFWPAQCKGDPVSHAGEGLGNRPSMLQTAPPSDHQQDNCASHLTKYLHIWKKSTQQVKDVGGNLHRKLFTLSYNKKSETGLTASGQGEYGTCGK